MTTLDSSTQRLFGLSVLAALALVIPASWLLTGPSLSGKPQTQAQQNQANPQTNPDEDAERPPSPASSPLDDAPPAALAFLEQVLERVPEGGVGITETRFEDWSQPGHATRAALGLKAIAGVDPDDLIARVMDVDDYEGRVAHVLVNQSRSVPATDPPESVHFYQRLNVPGLTRVQHELMLVDAGTIQGYRVALWYLLPEETRALDPGDGARSAFNVGVWLAAPGVVGYAFNSWPQRSDVNAVQWFSMTSGAAVVARRVIEGNIDGMADWARQ